MSGDEPHRDKHVKFTTASTDRLGKWAEYASDDDYGLVSETLLRVVDGTWRSECDCYQDVIHSLTWHILVRNGLIVTVRFAQEYPSMVQLIYIGPVTTEE
jgi:hypothetical protein